MDAKRITDVLLERPTGFVIDGRHFYLYPQTLGSSQLIGQLLSQLDINALKTRNYILGLSQVIAGNTDICLRIIAYSVLRGKEVLDNQRVDEVVRYLNTHATADDIVMLMQMILTPKSVNDILEHFKIDKELKEYKRVCDGKEDSGTVAFCGLSVWGNTISVLAEKYGWTMDYILWRISLDNINMLLADSPKTIYLSEKEMKKLHPKQAKNVIRADDPKNFDMIMSMNWN